MKDRFQELIVELTLIPFFLIGSLLNLIWGEGWETTEQKEANDA